MTPSVSKSISPIIQKCIIIQEGSDIVKIVSMPFYQLRLLSGSVSHPFGIKLRTYVSQDSYLDWGAVEEDHPAKELIETIRGSKYCFDFEERPTVLKNLKIPQDLGESFISALQDIGYKVLSFLMMKIGYFLKLLCFQVEDVKDGESSRTTIFTRRIFTIEARDYVDGLESIMERSTYFFICPITGEKQVAQVQMAWAMALSFQSPYSKSWYRKMGFELAFDTFQAVPFPNRVED
jgi:hypothetical protein